MRIVITGGAGFLGTRLARKLLERGTLTDARGDDRPHRVADAPRRDAVAGGMATIRASPPSSAISPIARRSSAR